MNAVPVTLSSAPVTRSAYERTPVTLSEAKGLVAVIAREILRSTPVTLSKAKGLIVGEILRFAQDDTSRDDTARDDISRDDISSRGAKVEPLT